LWSCLLVAIPVSRSGRCGAARGRTRGRSLTAAAGAIDWPMREEMERLRKRYTEAELAMLMGFAKRSAGSPAEFLRSLSAGGIGAGQVP